MELKKYRVNVMYRAPVYRTLTVHTTSEEDAERLALRMERLTPFFWSHADVVVDHEGGTRVEAEILDETGIA